MILKCQITYFITEKPTDNRLRPFAILFIAHFAKIPTETGIGTENVSK